MSRRERTKFEEIKPEMTPMIDVVFLLLIFFIVTLKFKTLEGRLDAALPKDRGTMNTTIEEIEKIDIVIKVVRKGSLVPDIATKTSSKPKGRLNHYVGRLLNFEIGADTFRTPEEVRKFAEVVDSNDRRWPRMTGIGQIAEVIRKWLRHRSGPCRSRFVLL